MAKRVLVTGGAGFLGSHLCDRLVQRGDHVICLDNLYTGRLDNIAHLLKRGHESPGHFEFVRHDVVHPYYAEVDEIYHLASPASPPRYQHNSIKTIKTNFLGTYHMLGLAKRTGAKIFQASTSEVYGDPLVHPQPESYWGHVNPIGIRSCYDEGKRIAETLCFDYQRAHHLRIKVVRIFNTYGPRMDPADGRVVSNFIVQALRGQPLTIYGDGQQTRSFCFVDDLIRGFIKLMDETPDSYCGPMNLGNPVEFTMVELAQLVKKLTKSKSPIVYEKLPADDPKQRKPDISAAHKIAGWQPEYPLETGLEHTIQYFAKVVGSDHR